MHFLALSFIVAALPPLPDAERVERLLSATHGYDPRLGAGLDTEAQEMCKKPGVYVPLLEGWLDPANFEPAKPELDRFRAQNALVVLVKFCGKDGRSAATKRLGDARAKRDDVWKQLQAVASGAVKDPKLEPEAKKLLQHHDELLTLERGGLGAFAGQKSADLVPALIPRIQSDVQLQLDLVRYFTAVAPGDPAIKSELGALLKKGTWKPLRDAIEAYLKLP